MAEWKRNLEMAAMYGGAGVGGAVHLASALNYQLPAVVNTALSWGFSGITVQAVVGALGLYAAIMYATKN